MSAIPRILYICGSINQTTQLAAVARAMSPHDAYFTPFFGDEFVDRMRRWGLIEASIGGNKRRSWCLDYLSQHGLAVDLDGERGGYDLVVTCTDLVVPRKVQSSRIVVVQEGILDPDRVAAWLCRRLGLPPWLAGTALTGESGLYDRFCVASRGYREHFVRRGAKPERVVVTGIPNFDDCARYSSNAFPHRGYVLAATSDTRETWKVLDSRREFIKRVIRIAEGRPIIFKLHPNENEERERRTIESLAPSALVFRDGSAEEMVANCDVLVTQWSSVVFVGLALGKEIHSNWSREELDQLCPVQNGGSSAAGIAAVCADVLGSAASPAKAVRTRELHTLADHRREPQM